MRVIARRERPHPGAQLRLTQIWLAIVALAADLLAWTQIVAWASTAPVRRWRA
jgi:hypothetical protein